MAAIARKSDGSFVMSNRSGPPSRPSRPSAQMVKLSHGDVLTGEATAAMSKKSFWMFVKFLPRSMPLQRFVVTSLS